MNPALHCKTCGRPWPEWRIDGICAELGLEYRTCCKDTLTAPLPEYADTEPCPAPSDAEMAAEILRGGP